MLESKNLLLMMKELADIKLQPLYCHAALLLIWLKLGKELHSSLYASITF